MATGEFWPRANLVALYHFDGNSTDSSGGGHNGTDTDMTYGNFSGKFGKGAAFNGTSSKIVAADHADWNFGSGDFTLAYWIKFVGTGTQELVSQSVNNTNEWSHYYAGGNFAWLLESGGTNLLNFSFTPTVGIWYWNCLTKISNNFTFYSNAAQKGSTQASATAVPDFAGSLYIGCGYDGATNQNFFSGTMDELVIFKGTGLTRKQVQDYYAWAAGRRSGSL